MAKGKNAGTRGSRKRRGRGETMTEAKAGAVEVRKGELSLHTVVLDENDVMTHVKSIKAAQEKKDTAVSLLRGATKAANKLHPVLAEKIKLAIALERKNDPKAFKEELEVEGIVLRATGCSIQLNVFDTLAGDQIELVYKRGFEDGKAGRTPDNRYPANSDLAKEYERGWQHGTADNLGISAEQFDLESAGASSTAEQQVEMAAE